jgi:aquaporin Z
MPRGGASRPGIPQKLSAEFVGTFFATLVPTVVDILYYTGGHVDYVSRWLARGFVTIALIYAFSEISGAHINPAISLGFAVRGVMRVRLMLSYWAAQFAGGFAAALLAYAVWGPLVALGASHPGLKYTHMEAVLTEIVLTFLVMLVILGCAEQEGVVGKQAALAVGLTVACCGFFAGPISGASMNPGRSIPPQIAGQLYDIIWIYAIGPCAGAALAAAAALAIFGKPDEGERKAAHGK